MAKGNNQKLKLLYMAKIFSEKTDENHGISVQEMISFLNQYEVNADRKTIYLDFEELRHFGMYGGETTNVTLYCESRMAGPIIDRFGKDIPMVKADAEHFNAYVEVSASPQFLG